MRDRLQEQLYRTNKEQRPIKVELKIPLSFKMIKEKIGGFMKKLLSLVTVMLVLVSFGIAQAGEGFSISIPMETTATAFWFPTDDTVAVGISHTVLRAAHSSLPSFSLDLDGTLAKEVNEAKDNLAGIGLKVNYHVQKATEAGFVFVPSVGVTALKNVKNFKDIALDWRVAVYGSVILYKW